MKVKLLLIEMVCNLWKQSAKNNTNVTEAFEALAKIMVESSNKKNTIKIEKKTIKVDNGANLNTKKKACC